MTLKTETNKAIQFANSYSDLPTHHLQTQMVHFFRVLFFFQDIVSIRELETQSCEHEDL